VGAGESSTEEITSSRFSPSVPAGTVTETLFSYFTVASLEGSTVFEASLVSLYLAFSTLYAALEEPEEDSDSDS
jgi:hypothetical protein